MAEAATLRRRCIRAGRIPLIFCMIAAVLAGCASQGPAVPPIDNSSAPASQNSTGAITSFEGCEAAGYPILESFPRQCRLPDGRTFVSSGDLAQISAGSRDNASAPLDSRLHDKCCLECREAYSQSPIAVGPHGARCGHFMTGSPISGECSEYFESFPSTVSDCE